MNERLWRTLMNKTLIFVAAISTGFGISASLVSFPAAAQPITYMLSDATATFDSEGTLDLTGRFTFNPASDILSSINITATGPIIFPLQFTPIEYTTPAHGAGDEITGQTISGDFRYQLTIVFASPLIDANVPVDLILINRAPTSGTGFVFNRTSSVTGSAVPTGVPEPATLGLMVLGMLGAGFAGRKRRN